MNETTAMKQARQVRAELQLLSSITADNIFINLHDWYQNRCNNVNGPARTAPLEQRAKIFIREGKLDYLEGQKLLKLVRDFSVKINRQNHFVTKHAPLVRPTNIIKLAHYVKTKWLI